MGRKLFMGAPGLRERSPHSHQGAPGACTARIRRPVGVGTLLEPQLGSTWVCAPRLRSSPHPRMVSGREFRHGRQGASSWGAQPTRIRLCFVSLLGETSSFQIDVGWCHRPPCPRGPCGSKGGSSEDARSQLPATRGKSNEVPVTRENFIH